MIVKGGKLTIVNFASHFTDRYIKNCTVEETPFELCTRIPERWIRYQAVFLRWSTRWHLTLKQDMSLSLSDEDVGRNTLQVSLDILTGNDRKTCIFLRADKAVEYGDLMEVMNLLRTAGYLKIALVGLESIPVADPASPGIKTQTGIETVPTP